MFRWLAAVALFLSLPQYALAADSGVVVVSPPGSDTTLAKADGEKIILKKTPTGTVGKMGKDKVLVHKDGNGNTFAKIGKDKMFCHSDPASGLTFCK